MKTNPARLAALVVVTLLIGWFDYLSGNELDLFVLYFVPVSFAAWKIGFRPACAIALLGGALWYSANVYLGHAYTQLWFAAFGEGVMLTMFVACAFATSRIRGLLDHERELNVQLAAALAKVKKLSGRLPICMSCKSIQDDAGGWHQLEEYFTRESEDDFVFAQCICPHCRPNGHQRPAAATPTDAPVGAAV